MSTRPYEVLGVSPYASQEEIKQAFWDISRECHPDGGSNTNLPRMQEATEAYAQINTRAKRQALAWSTRSSVYKASDEKPGPDHPEPKPPAGSGKRVLVAALCVVCFCLFVAKAGMFIADSDIPALFAAAFKKLLVIAVGVGGLYVYCRK